MPRVCIVVQSHYDTDPRVLRQVRALTGAGHEVHVVCLRHPGEERKRFADGATIHGIPLERRRGSIARYALEYGVFLLTAGWKVLQLMLEQRFDIVQVCNLPDILILTVVLPKLLGAKALFDAHDGTPEGLMIQKGYRAESLVVRLATLFERLAFALADEAITVHEAIRQHFMQRGANGDKISVVMNVPDREVFFDTRTKPAGTCRETFTLIYAGSITRPYGLDTAIRALPLLYEIANLRLRIIGRGNYQAQLAYLAEELGVSGKISFEPPVPQEQVRTLYQQADIGISPHTGGLFGEICFSNKVSEYLAVGLPAVVSRTPVYEHYFDDRHVSFCTPDDPQSFAGCVRKIYEHPDYRRSLVQNGLERIQQLSWQNEKERYLAVIDRLAGKDVTDASPLR